MKKIKFNFWLLGFGCGVIFTGMIGTLVTLNVSTSPNVQQQSTAAPEEIEQEDTSKNSSAPETKTPSTNEQQTQAQDNNKEETVVVYRKVDIPNSFDAKRICNLLEEKEIVEDGTAFLEYIKEHGKQRYLKSGQLSLPKGGSYEEILALLVY